MVGAGDGERIGSGMMKEVFEKIKERLVELGKLDVRIVGGRYNGKTFELGYRKGVADAIEIVDQVVAECGNDVVYNLAMSYAICLSKYGVDITEKLETTTQNAYALNQAYMRGRQEERDKFDKWREEFADDTNVGSKSEIPTSSEYKLHETVDKFFSHNEIVALWKEEKDEISYHKLLWRGMAWDIPKEYKTCKFVKIFGTIPESITEADTINIEVEND